MPRVYRSSFPDVEVPSTDLLSHLFSNPLNTPLDRPIYIDAVSGKNYTFGDVIQRTKSLAHGLRQTAGVQPNDVVALWSPNTIDYPIACHAVVGCGAILSPTSAALTAPELTAQLNTSRARFIIVHSSLLQTAITAVKASAAQPLIIPLDGAAPFNNQPSCAHLITTYAPTDLITIPSSQTADKIAYICFSSGTSGVAKGVITTHTNITANLQQWRALMLDSGAPHERVARRSAIAFLPFSHIYGLNLYMCQCLLWGTSVVILPRFDLDAYLSAIEKYQPDELALVPPVALLLVKDERVAKYNLSSVRRVMSAAAPLTSELASALESRFRSLHGTTVHCVQSWGLTETSPMATGLPNNRMDKRAGVGCIGPSMEFRFVDPESMADSAVGADGSVSPGEIWVRGPNVTRGYYNNEDATKGAYHVDETGVTWFRTGDIGSMDSEGFVTIQDRIKEMIKYKGLQVIPSELEGKLVDHPDIEDAAVTGVWVDEMATELPVGFLVLSREAKQREQGEVLKGIHAWLNERVANHKRLRGGVIVLDEIPKSPSGKILRRVLKEMLKKQPRAKL